MENIIVKSLLFGLVAGLLIGLTGENWDFKLHYYAYGIHAPQNKEWFGHYGSTQAVIGGILVSLIAFLKYNKK
jgi:hypothetical protein